MFFSLYTKRCQGVCFLECIIILIFVIAMSVCGLSYLREFKQRLELHHHTLSLVIFLQHAQRYALWYTYPIHIEMVSTTCHTCFTLKGASFIGKKSYCVPSSVSVTTYFLTEKRWCFFGKRMTLNPGSLVLQNKTGETRIIISNGGRIRYCGHPQPTLGMPQC